MKKIGLVVTFITVFLILLLAFSQNNRLVQKPNPTVTTTPTATPSAVPNQILGVRTKTFGCAIQNSSPDKDCTPGAIIVGVTKDQVCIPGYAKSVRNVSESEKEQVFLEYGIVSHSVGEYEIDHLISLELGGSNDISNLWPQASEPRPGFHEKDKVENYLHQQVCSKDITLEEAQQQISTNWLEVYQKISQ